GEGATTGLGALEVPDREEPARRAELLLALGEARLRFGDPASRDAFVGAAAAARELEDPELLARAALGFSGLGVSIIAVDGEKVALLEEALAVLPDDRPLRARVLARLAIETFYASGPERRNQPGDEAVASARRSGDDRALLQALNARRVALWSPANLEERLEADGEMIELAQRAGDVEAVLQARNWRVADLAELGDIDGMLAEVD